MLRQSQSPASVSISIPLCVTDAPFTLTRAALTSARGELTLTLVLSFSVWFYPFRTWFSFRSLLENSQKAHCGDSGHFVSQLFQSVIVDYSFGSLLFSRKIRMKIVTRIPAILSMSSSVCLLICIYPPDLLREYGSDVATY